MEKRPVEFHSDLSAEHIKIVAQIIALARQACNEEFDEERGDTNWSYGCRAREWTRQSLREASEGGKYPWLTILEDSNQKFVIRIGQVPVKFFKENIDDPTDRILKVSAVEAEQLSLLIFAGLEDSNPLKWRILVETGQERDILGIRFVGLNALGDSVCLYDVPYEDGVTLVTDNDTVPKEGVELAPAQVGLKAKKKDTERGVNGG